MTQTVIFKKKLESLYDHSEKTIVAKMPSQESQLCQSNEHQNQTYINPKPIHSIIYFELSGLENAHQVPSSAPPPKLHYSTFWRSMTRRVYFKTFYETRQGQLDT
jgi:hypothetical protein